MEKLTEVLLGELEESDNTQVVQTESADKKIQMMMRHIVFPQTHLRLLQFFTLIST